MKAKPDISGFQAQPQAVADFLEGGAADRAEKTKPSAPQKSTESKKIEDVQIVRVQKVFRIAQELSYLLKDAALAESKATGKRITENEIAERAIQLEVTRMLKARK
jgi:hypothetical protein